MSDDTQKAQIDLAKRLQTMLLEEYERRLLAGTISDTGLSALQKLLTQTGGWTLDEKDLPQGLKDKLLKDVDPSMLEDSDADVLPFQRRA